MTARIQTQVGRSPQLISFHYNILLPNVQKYPAALSLLWEPIKYLLKSEIFFGKKKIVVLASVVLSHVAYVWPKNKLKNLMVIKYNPREQ